MKKNAAIKNVARGLAVKSAVKAGVNTNPLYRGSWVEFSPTYNNNSSPHSI